MPPFGANLPWGDWLDCQPAAATQPPPPPPPPPPAGGGGPRRWDAWCADRQEQITCQLHAAYGLPNSLTGQSLREVCRGRDNRPYCQAFDFLPWIEPDPGACFTDPGSLSCRGVIVPTLDTLWCGAHPGHLGCAIGEMNGLPASCHDAPACLWAQPDLPETCFQQCSDEIGGDNTAFDGCMTACSGEPYCGPLHPPTNPTKASLLWRGFSHRWERINHRLERLGSWVDVSSSVGGYDDRVCERSVPARAEGTANTTASTGTATDDAHYYTYASGVTTSSAIFMDGSVFLSLDAYDEGYAVSRVQTVTVLLPPDLTGPVRAVPVLGGFDLRRDAADDEADKIAELSIDVSEATVAPDSRSLTFEVSATFQGDCRSLECVELPDPGQTGETLYDLTVQWALIVGADDELGLIHDELRDDYTWGPYDTAACPFGCPENELFRMDLEHAVTIAAEPGFEATVALVRGFSVSVRSEDVSQGSYLQEMAFALRDQSFDPTSGQLNLTADMFFKAWRAWEAEGWLSDGFSGEADTTLSLAVVQFREGSVTPMSVSGEFEQNEQRVVTDALALPR